MADKKLNIVVMHFPSLSSYIDRVEQMDRLIPPEYSIYIFTKDDQSCISSNFSKRLVFIKQPQNVKSVFFGIFFVLRLCGLAKKNKIIVVDWFKTLWLSSVLAIAIKHLDYIYAPVISELSWFHKRSKKKVPFLGIRYDWLRFKGLALDYVCCKLADKIVVQSYTLKQEYKYLYSKNDKDILVNYNAIRQTDKLQLKCTLTPRKNIKILFASNVENHKGLGDLIRIFSGLDSRFKLDVFGKVRGEKNSKLFDDLKALCNVTYRGFADPTDLAKTCEEYDILLLPSYHEGSPRIISETINQMEIIIGYNNPGLDYITDLDGVYLFEYGDWKGIKSKLVELSAGIQFTRAIISRDLSKDLFIHLKNKAMDYHFG